MKAAIRCTPPTTCALKTSEIGLRVRHDQENLSQPVVEEGKFDTGRVRHVNAARGIDAEPFVAGPLSFRFPPGVLENLPLTSPQSGTDGGLRGVRF